VTGPLTIHPVKVEGEFAKGDAVTEKILDALSRAGLALMDGDVVVITHKIVSKAEGRVATLPEGDAVAKAALLEAEAVRIVRRRNGLVIAQTKHGLICANAGIDSSNVRDGAVTLLPIDPDRSARRIRSRVKRLAGVDVAVIITDTFGRPWRLGQTNVAIGVAGMLPSHNYRGTTDSFGRELHVTNIAIADELAGAAELVMGKAEGIPVAVVRGLDFQRGRGSARQLIRSPQDDLFL
jgi:coenzyme F420-0:L-glutamate ligase / coenzyme F420-1:gamma-L-glutamate ligase